MRTQHTIASPITCSGVGLHSGQPVSMTLLPAPPDSGVVFIRKGAGTPIRFSASIHHLVSTELCTALASQGAQLKTIEHLLAALAGLGVDNVLVEIDASEVPVLDGSAGPFVRLIREAGILPQKRAQPFLKITQPIEVTDGHRRVTIEPSSTPRVSYTIAYNHPMIGHQSFEFEYSPNGFAQEIADARTFGFLKEVEALWSRGLGKGGSLDNTVILSETGVVNETGLRFQDEFVRHKILDLIGDMALMGMPFIGHVKAERSGHALHTKLVSEILRRPDCWVLLTGTDTTPAVEYNIPTHQPFAPAASIASAA
ncbi:MAG: UDP-3-O-acyl-N-acetylglucosamine deacetylase [Nitrospiraceae bacterium]